MYKTLNSKKQKLYSNQGNAALKLDESYNLQTTQNSINNLYIVADINSTSTETPKKSLINKIQTLLSIRTIVNIIKLYNNIIDTKPWTYENTPIKIKRFVDALFVNGILMIISFLTGILIGIILVV